MGNLFIESRQAIRIAAARLAMKAVNVAVTVVSAILVFGGLAP